MTAVSLLNNRSTWIGRFSLYSLTVLIVSCPLTIFAAFLWLVTPLPEESWLIVVYRTLVAFTIASGGLFSSFSLSCIDCLFPSETFPIERFRRLKLEASNNIL